MTAVGKLVLSLQVLGCLIFGIWGLWPFAAPVDRAVEPFEKVVPDLSGRSERALVAPAPLPLPPKVRPAKKAAGELPSWRTVGRVEDENGGYILQLRGAQRRLVPLKQRGKP